MTQDGIATVKIGCVDYAPTHIALPHDSIHAECSGQLFDQTTFWSPWYQDVEAAAEQVIIVCPFVSQKYTPEVVTKLLATKQKQVRIVVVARTKSEQWDSNQDTLLSLPEKGIDVHMHERIHQKLCIIDDRIVWEGSLNILSHGDSLNHMRRFESASVARQIKSTNAYIFDGSF